MELKNLTVKLVSQEPGIKGMYKQCELVGRVCYHSESRISDDSYKKFIEEQVKHRHMSPLEAGTVYLGFDYTQDTCKMLEFFKQNPFSFAVEMFGKVYVTTNYRVIVENELHEFMESNWCEPTSFHVLRHCVKMQCNIAAYKDFTRHRASSPMVESTRFCNYAKGKFNMSVNFIDPSEVGVPDEYRDEWIDDLKTLEQIYLKWANRVPAQTASQFLCQETAATAFFTAFTCDWQHFCDLRFHELTGPVRPECKELASQTFILLKEFGIV